MIIFFYTHHITFYIRVHTEILTIIYFYALSLRFFTHESIRILISGIKNFKKFARGLFGLISYYRDGTTKFIFVSVL